MSDLDRIKTLARNISDFVETYEELMASGNIAMAIQCLDAAQRRAVAAERDLRVFKARLALEV